jgi:hypothetical protein
MEKLSISWGGGATGTFEAGISGVLISCRQT